MIGVLRLGACKVLGSLQRLCRWGAIMNFPTHFVLHVLHYSVKAVNMGLHICALMFDMVVVAPQHTASRDVCYIHCLF